FVKSQTASFFLPAIKVGIKFRLKSSRPYKKLLSNFQSKRKVDRDTKYTLKIFVKNYFGYGINESNGTLLRNLTQA
ncbi:MAG: hypothetical protein WA974_04445, partial [Thermodesulfobacteriota bacterium]